MILQADSPHKVPVMLLKNFHHTERAGNVVAVDSPRRGPVLLLQWIHHIEDQCYRFSGFTTHGPVILLLQ